MNIETGDIVYVKRPCGWFVFLRRTLSQTDNRPWWDALVQRKRQYSGPRWPHSVDNYDFNKNAVELITSILPCPDGEFIITSETDRKIVAFLDKKQGLGQQQFNYAVQKKPKYRYDWQKQELVEVT